MKELFKFRHSFLTSVMDDHTEIHLMLKHSCLNMGARIIFLTNSTVPFWCSSITYVSHLGHALFHTDLYFFTEDRQNLMAGMMADSFLSILWHFATHCGPSRLVCSMPSGRLLGSPVLLEPCLCMRSKPEDQHFPGSCHSVLLRLWITPTSLWCQGKHQTMLCCTKGRESGDSPCSSQGYEDVMHICNVTQGLTSSVMTEQLAENDGWNHQPSSVFTSWTPCKCQRGHGGHETELWSRHSWRTALSETFTLHRKWPKWALEILDYQILLQCVLQSGHDNQNLTAPGSSTASQLYV